VKFTRDGEQGTLLNCLSHDSHFGARPSERLFVFSVRRFHVRLSCESHPRNEIETVSLKGWYNKLETAFLPGEDSRTSDSIP